MLRNFRINSKEDFSIWFDRKYKKEYYITQLEMCKTKFIKESNGKYNTIKLKSGYSKDFDGSEPIYYSSSDLLNPFEENYGMFLINFLNANFSNFETAYLTFFCFYGIKVLQEFVKDFPQIRSFNSEQEYKSYYEEIFYNVRMKIKKLQNTIRLAVNYSYNLKNAPYYKSSPTISKFIAYSIQNNLFRYLDHIDMYYNINYAYNTNELTTRDVSPKDITYIIDSRIINPSESNIFSSTYISSLMYATLTEIVNNPKVTIGICKNCGKYFISYQKKSDTYCRITYCEDDKICKDIGVQISYKKKQKDNPCLILYRQTYQKKLMYAKRSNDEKVKENFNEWKLLARQKVKDFNNGLLKDNDLIEWLKEF